MQTLLLIKEAKAGIEDVVNIQLPGSKSITNRVLIIKALQQQSVGKLDLTQECDDVRVMQQILDIVDNRASSNDNLVLHCGGAGAVARMAAFYASLKGGNYILTGDSRLKERPVDELYNTLLQAGVIVEYKGVKGFLPIIISSEGINKKSYDITIGKSSQHLSGLLLISPYIKGGAEITVTGMKSSYSYVDMTIKIMRRAGIKVIRKGDKIIVDEGEYTISPELDEADWSSAAFFYQAVAIFPGMLSLFLEGLKKTGLQGDERAECLFKELGVSTELLEDGALIRKDPVDIKPVNVDFTNTPDLFNAYATAVAIKNIPARFTGLNNLVHKESDRLTSFITTLKSIGYQISYDNGILQVTPQKQISLTGYCDVDSINDHRLAMSFSVMGLVHGIALKGADSVNKSFPGFYNQLEKISNLERVL